MEFGSKGVSKSHSVVAVILGGGRGTRLYPLTLERAKPAVPVAGRYRLVDIPLSNCINSGINRVFVVTQYNSRSLNQHINNTYKFDNFSKGFVEILAAEQTITSGNWFQGTADAIRQNLWHLRNTECSHYLILSGDHLYRMDYSDFLRRHLDTNADITVSTVPITRNDASEFGIMHVGSDGRIVEFVEKPQTDAELDRLRTPTTVMSEFGLDDSEDRRYLASMGVYLFKRDLLHRLLSEKREWYDFGKDVIPGSLKDLQVFSYLFGGFWEDIGTVRSFYDVSMRLLHPNAPFKLIEPDKPIYSRPRYLPGSQIENAVIKNSLICEGSQISGAEITETIIGIRSIIRENANIRRSILMGADFFETSNVPHLQPIGIGPGSTIENAIIDKNARIGENVIIRGSAAREDKNCEEEGYCIVDGIAVVLKNAIIPNNTVIE